MLAKLTSKSHLALPKAVLREFPACEYLDVTAENARIVLTPVRLTRANAARAKLVALGITEADLQEAVEWVRRPPQAGRWFSTQTS